MNVQDEPTHQQRWKASLPVVLILGFILLSALFFLPVPPEFRTKIGSAVLNTGHVIFFCLFALAFYPFMLGRNRTRIPRFLFVVFALSLIVELIQSTVGRAFQWEDILRNVLGSILGISIQIHFQGPHKPHWALRTLLLVTILVAVVYERMPLINKVMAHYQTAPTNVATHNTK